MKIEIQPRATEHGSVILVCLSSSIIIAIALASYMVLSQHEYVSVMRSQTWNRTIPVTEAGTEEAMALVNKFAFTSTDITAWTNSAQADGWSSLGGNTYYIRRYLGSDYYDVYITNLNNAPAIKSIATLAWNYKYAYAPQVSFAAIGASLPSPTNTTRAILIQTAPPTNYFLFGILAKKGISITGGGTNDSVNSRDPSYRTNPWSITLEHANGSLGTIESNVTAAASESSSTIFGHVYTGPGSTITTSGGSGGIGDTSWLASNPGKIEPGWTNNTLHIAIPDAPTAPPVIPFAVGNPGLPTYILVGNTSGPPKYYSANAGANYGGGCTILVTNGAVALICKGDFTLSGGSSLQIADGSSLTAYFTGKTTLSGGGVVNGTGYATNCTFYGSTNCTSITYSGASGFIGTVDAPYANYTQSGGSGVIGALIVNSFTQSGGKSLLRYDEALAGPGTGSVYRIISWQEVPP